MSAECKSCGSIPRPPEHLTFKRFTYGGKTYDVKCCCDKCFGTVKISTEDMEGLRILSENNWNPPESVDPVTFDRLTAIKEMELWENKKRCIRLCMCVWWNGDSCFKCR